MKGRIGGDFHVTENRMVFVTLTKGGCHTKRGGGVTPQLSFIPLILIGLSPLFVAPLCRTGKIRGDDSDPPRNGPPMRSRVKNLRHRFLPRPQGVAIAGIDPCGKAKRAQERRFRTRRPA